VSSYINIYIYIFLAVFHDSAALVLMSLGPRFRTNALYILFHDSWELNLLVRSSEIRTTVQPFSHRANSQTKLVFQKLAHICNYEL
jgi:hypothetical protein